MSKHINNQKKIQRVFLKKNRIEISKKINLKKFLFYNCLKKYKWFLESKNIATFISINSEVPTASFNNFLENEGKVLCLPVINDRCDQALIFKKYIKKNDLIIAKYNIPEPDNNFILLPDLIFVPCLGFDINGFRLGYGGGYYDKTISYLKNKGHKFLTVGLAYDDQKIDEIIHDNLDQKINYFLTEKQLYTCL